MKRLYIILILITTGMAGNIAMAETSLMYFKASYADSSNSVYLEWQTAAEVNCLLFRLERSTDGLNWQEIGTLAGQGNSDVPKLYTLIDLHPEGGMNYYRLSAWDYNGDVIWFDPVSVDCTSAGTEELFVYYNNGLRDIRVEFYSTIDRPNSRLQVMDGNGRLILSDQIDILKGKTLWVYKTDNATTNMYIGTLWCTNGDNFLKKVLILD